MARLQIKSTVKLVVLTWSEHKLVEPFLLTIVTWRDHGYAIVLEIVGAIHIPKELFRMLKNLLLLSFGKEDAQIGKISREDMCLVDVHQLMLAIMFVIQLIGVQISCLEKQEVNMKAFVWLTLLGVNNYQILPLLTTKHLTLHKSMVSLHQPRLLLHRHQHLLQLPHQKKLCLMQMELCLFLLQSS